MEVAFKYEEKTFRVKHDKESTWGANISKGWALGPWEGCCTDAAPPVTPAVGTPVAAVAPPEGALVGAATGWACCSTPAGMPAQRAAEIIFCNRYTILKALTPHQSYH